MNINSYRRLITKVMNYLNFLLRKLMLWGKILVAFGIWNHFGFGFQCDAVDKGWM